MVKPETAGSRYLIKTLGCKANLADSIEIEAQLRKRGFEPETWPSASSEDGSPGNEVQLCVVNTCSVTDEAHRQSKKMAQRLARENPQAVVVVTGCAAEVAPDEFMNTPGVRYVIGNQDKNQLADWLARGEGSDILHQEELPRILGKARSYTSYNSKHPIDREWPQETAFFQPSDLHRTRCFLKIQEGCDSFCTYCIIPYGRGRARSPQISEIIKSIQEYAASGIREVVLTGTNIGDFGRDWAGRPQIDELVKKILTDTDLERLRISSLDPTEISPQLLALMESNPRLCPHFHVSLQSASTRILKRMKRRYTTEQVIECLSRIAQLNIRPRRPYVGMDLITGFPGESDDEFDTSLELLSKLPWTRLHVFPYSERAGTPATRLKEVVPLEVRKSRARRLAALSMERLATVYQSVVNDGHALEGVLIEKPDPQGWSQGFTPDYIRVLIPPDKQGGHRNQVVTVIPREKVKDHRAQDCAIIGKLLAP